MGTKLLLYCRYSFALRWLANNARRTEEKRLFNRHADLYERRIADITSGGQHPRSH